MQEFCESYMSMCEIGKKNKNLWLQSKMRRKSES